MWKDRFFGLVTCLAEAPFLHEFVPGSALELWTDASDYAIGAALVQTTPDNKECPIAFFSRMLSEPERRYSVFEKETLAMHQAITRFRTYLVGLRFVVKTGHKPLEDVFKEGAAKRRVNPLKPRWFARMLDLEEFDFQVQYVMGRSNVVADAMSRVVSSIYVPWDDLEQAQKWDGDCVRLRSNDGHVMERGILRKKLPGERTVIVLPAAFQRQAVKEAHHGPVGGHFFLSNLLQHVQSEEAWSFFNSLLQRNQQRQ
jgi:hypothetical protein